MSFYIDNVTSSCEELGLLDFGDYDDDENEKFTLKLRQSVQAFVLEHIGKYADYDRQSAKSDPIEFFQEMYPNSQIQLQDAEEGRFGAKFVIIEGVRRYVIKKADLPNQVYYNHVLTNRIETHLQQYDGTFQQQVNQLLLENNFGMLTQKFSIVNQLQREKLAAVVGKNYGVPATQIVRMGDNVCSVHTFSQNTNSITSLINRGSRFVHRLQVQQVQSMAVLDMLLQNQDRNSGKVLVRDAAWPIALSYKVFHDTFPEANWQESCNNETAYKIVQ